MENLQRESHTGWSPDSTYRIYCCKVTFSRPPAAFNSECPSIPWCSCRTWSRTRSQLFWHRRLPPHCPVFWTSGRCFPVSNPCELFWPGGCGALPAVFCRTRIWQYFRWQTPRSRWLSAILCRWFIRILNRAFHFRTCGRLTSSHEVTLFHLKFDIRLVYLLVSCYSFGHPWFWQF